MRPVINVLRSKRWTFVLFVIIAVLLAGTVAISVSSFMDMNFSTELSRFLEGKLSIDDGEWQDFSVDEPINQPFRKAVIKGKPMEEFSLITNLTISSQNVWYTIYNDQGGSVIEHHYLTPEEIYNGEIGELHNIRFIVTPTAPVWSGEAFTENNRYLTMTTTYTANDSGGMPTAGAASSYKLTIAETPTKEMVGRYCHVYDKSAGGYVNTVKIVGVHETRALLLLQTTDCIPARAALKPLTAAPVWLYTAACSSAKTPTASSTPRAQALR